ncbi:MAG: ferritin [Candidatus Lokiarchaeota archaeon]|nr:ferritin [Candidatus Lokiarchaeota archaeon]
MGKKAIEIVDIDVKKLIELLNKAYADEWLAHYQYWIGAKIVKGPMRGVAVRELEEHAGEEYDHATKLAERIIQLGGIPLINPKAWYEKTNCGYENPLDHDVKKIVEQNLEGERCAIDVYKDLLNTIHGKDEVTYNLIVDILDDELEHEEDLQAIIEDIEVIQKR